MGSFFPPFLNAKLSDNSLLDLYSPSMDERFPLIVSWVCLQNRQLVTTPALLIHTTELQCCLHRQMQYVSHVLYMIPPNSSLAGDVLEELTLTTASYSDSQGSLRATGARLQLLHSPCPLSRHTVPFEPTCHSIQHRLTQSHTWSQTHKHSGLLTCAAQCI